MTPAGYTIERATTASRLGTFAGLVLLVVLIALPFWGTSSDMRLLVEILSMLTLAQMWNLLAGYGGLVSVGQQAYIGLGGYALNVLADFLGINPFLSVFLAGLVATAFALPTAALVFRFQGGYFAVGTWVVAEVYHLLIANSSALGGGLGRSLQAIRGIPRSERERLTYWIAMAVGVGAIALVYLLLRSRWGLALTAIRDSPRASESLGIDVFRSKLFVYLVAAFGCGVAGALLYLNLLRILPPAAFSVNWTAAMIFVVVIGGIGTIEGPIVGTLVFFALRELLADYGAWYLIILGAVAIVVMVWAPQGLWGVIAARFDLRFFPVQRRVRLAAPVGDASSARAAGGGSAPFPGSP
jgi:branched-chain amino acid transport system permease protein